MDIEESEIHPNLIRKIDAKELPEQISFRLKDRKSAIVFEKLRKEYQKRTGNIGNQGTCEFITRLAWQKYKELEEKEKEIEKAANK